MNSNNNQRRTPPANNSPIQNPGNVRPHVRRNANPADQDGVRRPINDQYNRRQAAPVPNRPVNRQNGRSMPQAPVGAQKRAVQPQKKTAQQAKKPVSVNRTDRIAIVVLLIIILLAVVLIAKACKGNVEPRDRYEISDTLIVDETPADDASDAFLPVSDENTRPMDEEITSKYAVMVARSDGRIIASREADTVIYPASLTKIMSLVVAVEQTESLDETIVFTNDMISPFYEQNASLAGFKEGEEVTLKDLLYGMILVSGADATEGVVRICTDNEASFVGLMNQKAAALGLKDTHFVNAVGLHDKDHYSTCNEMAVILDYALNNETCREILSTYKYTTAATEQNPDGIELTSNIQSRMEGGESGVARIHGGKTGYTESAGNCLASFASSYSDGEEYIIVTCLGGDVYAPIFDHINMCKIYLAKEENTDESV
ncbi:MAG: D-alanyl-D-alanine carboxypeptidase [Clostridia bacterium]|nr:D-alanyl-D-alanine carboxypeptidase [Clostridia bacterium]